MSDLEAVVVERNPRPDADLVGFKEVAKSIREVGTAVQEFPANVRSQLRLVETAYYAGCGTGVLAGLALAVVYVRLFGWKR